MGCMCKKQEIPESNLDLNSNPPIDKVKAALGGSTDMNDASKLTHSESHVNIIYKLYQLFILE